VDFGRCAEECEERMKHKKRQHQNTTGEKGRTIRECDNIENLDLYEVIIQQEVLGRNNGLFSFETTTRITEKTKNMEKGDHTNTRKQQGYLTTLISLKY
jgi:hypothetical protein